MSVRQCTYLGLVRIDDRLVHGQVLLNWSRELGLRFLAVVDDQAAGDPLIRSLTEAVVPRSISLWIGSVAETYDAFCVKSRVSSAHSMILVRSPGVARELYDAGIQYVSLQLGCLGLLPGRRRILRQVSLSPHEMEVLESLVSLGVDVVAQALPRDPVVSWAEVRRRSSSVLPG